MKNLILTFISILLVIIISELTLRSFYQPISSGWGWEDSPRRSLSKFENDAPNQLGLRGQQISYDKNDFVVLLVGDSQVESATSSPDEMPEKYLQRFISEKMNREVKVFSIAASGWGQDQQLLALEQYYKKYRADLVLIWSTPKNDFWENTFPDRSLTKVAGHLKPTYSLNDDLLSGPFLEPNKYYKGSILLQLFYSAIQTLKNETLEQLILADWNEKLPNPHNLNDFNSKINERNFTEVSLNGFSKNLPEYSKSDSILLIVNEDFLNSRSHFSPFGRVLSERDKYLISITRKLFEKIHDTCASNNSTMLVFYPVRAKYDLVYSRCIRYIKNPYNQDVLFPVNIDYLTTLKKVVPSDQLITWNLDSEKDLCVSPEDRHLNEYGNELVMERLAEIIKGAK